MFNLENVGYIIYKYGFDSKLSSVEASNKIKCELEKEYFITLFDNNIFFEKLVNYIKKYRKGESLEYISSLIIKLINDETDYIVDDEFLSYGLG